jgi:hypothetical protein
MVRRHGNFTPLKPLNSDSRIIGRDSQIRFIGTAKIVQRGIQHTYLLKVTDTDTGKVVLEKEVRLNPDGGIDKAIGEAHNLASEFKPKVFRSKK